QKHTFDLILIEIVAAVFWFNPLVKVMHRFINSNLEFIVDQKMIETTESVLYQKNLLQFQTQQVIQFANSFNASEIKNRIFQKHTFDLILIEIVAAVFWFNPLVKVMQRFINSNLEFIVDQKMIETTESVLYQKNLLQFQTQQVIQFANSFNASEIKNRILQINAKKSTHMKKLKFLLATPVLVAFFTLFQIETVAQVKETLEVQEIEETSFLVRENFTKEDFAKLSK